MFSNCCPNSYESILRFSRNGGRVIGWSKLSVLSLIVFKVEGSVGRGLLNFDELIFKKVSEGGS